MSSWIFKAVVASAIAVAALVWFVLDRRAAPARRLAEARAAIAAKNYARAAAALDAAEASSAVRDEAGLLRVRLLLDGGAPASAAKALDRVPSEGPHAAAHAYWKGRVLFAAGQPTLAELWFRTALAKNPADADAARWLAASAYEIGDRSTVVEALLRVAELDPKDPRARRTLGVVYRENEEHELACDALLASLKLDRAQPALRLDLADSLLKVGRIDEAERELDECEGRAPEGRRSELAAAAALKRGATDLARHALDAGLAAEPGRPGLLVARARMDLAEGRPETALERLNRAVAADPYVSEAFYLRAQVLKALGRDVDSTADFERAAALTRDLAELSRVDDLAAKSPHDPEIRFKLGGLCETLGKLELAVSWYKAALACDPKHEGASAALARSIGRRPGPSLP